MSDFKFMKMAIKLAAKAEKKNEVPVGAVIVKDDKIIARGYNKRETDCCATSHAEMIAIKKACKKLGAWRLTGCDLYVTLEPCPMCCGAAINSRIDNIIFGAYDPKAGACGTILNLCDTKELNHHPTVTGGVMEKECSLQLTNFFRNLRKIKKEEKNSNI